MKLIMMAACALMLVSNVGMAKSKQNNSKKMDRKIASEGAPFSAFVSDNVLYVTIMGDCNHHMGSLQVSEECNKNRRTKDLVRTCEAEVMVMMSRMACPGQKLTPKVLTIPLEKSDVAPEAHKLKLTYAGEEISVKINKAKGAE